MGAELYLDGQVVEVPTLPVEENDPTGAGDIFAASFLIAKIIEGKSDRDAARFANALAGISIHQEGVDGIPTASEIAQVQRNQ
jgi:sugar/nucleoside kinase (ribokinase family)